MSTIIIEGFDNTGKTTLAKELARILGYQYVSGGGPEVGTYKGALERLKKDMPNKVQDRTWISEIIYGTVIRKHSGINAAEEKQMIKFHLENNIFLIYAKRPLKRIMETISSREQMDGVIECAPQLLDAYDKYMLEKLPKYLYTPIIYNFEENSIPELLELLRNSGIKKE